MKQEIVKYATKFGNLVAKNSPHIFTGLAVAGVIGTVVLVARAQVKADKIISDEEMERADEAIAKEEDFKPVTFKDKVKLTWKTYIPAAISGASTITFIVLSDTTNTKRMAALSALYAASQKTLEEYKSTVEEVADKKTLKAIRDKQADNVINNLPEDDSICQGKGGHQLFYDELSGQPFYSDPESIRHAEVEFNRTLISEYQMTANEWLTDYLGINPSTMAERLGWNTNQMLRIHIDYRPFSDTNLSPLGIVKYDVDPTIAYKDW